jgi:hypothetical protein
MKKLLYVALAFFTSNFAFAQSTSLNLAIPQSAQNFQSDRVRAGDLECSAAIGSATNVEFGVVGILNQNDPYANIIGNTAILPNDPRFAYSNEFVRDVGVYAKITIPIGAPKERLNCNALYKLELEKKRLEVLKLQQELENLRKLKFEN